VGHELDKYCVYCVQGIFIECDNVLQLIIGF